MKKILLFILLFSGFPGLNAAIIEKTFLFGNYSISLNDGFQTFSFNGTMLFGIPGEPLLPWQKVTLMLPPGEAAVSVEIIREGEVQVNEKILLAPAQHVRPVSMPGSPGLSMNHDIYLADRLYPSQVSGQLTTQHLQGYAFAFTTFTPVAYNPLKKRLSYYSKITVRVHTQPDPWSQQALSMMSGSEKEIAMARRLAQNPEMAGHYPGAKSPGELYQYLIVSPEAFKNEFQPIITMYAGKGISVRVVPLDSITGYTAGDDAPEQIRNFIISQRQNHSIQYVLLAGNPPLMPFRGFYCRVLSGGSYYTDYNIPADLYFSGLDGTYDADGDNTYGEVTDDPDLLPDVSVARFTVNDTAELRRMIRKTIAYQTNPVLGEFSRPLLAGEFLYANPVTYGSDYLELLINDHTDNNYFTHGIPSATNNIQKLYDTPSWNWNKTTLLASINQGNSFIHHLGHAYIDNMLRLNMSDITNANFSQVNGKTHNFQLLYTQGCYDGAFDYGCIAAQAVKIENFLVAGIFNSRYGWFNEGTTEGPSLHLQREFVSAMYNDTTPEKHIGTAHMISKIESAPWVTMTPEFEPGARRWCHYCCNVFGDPALEIWTEEPTVFTNITWTGDVDSDWNNPGNWDLAKVPTTLCDVIIPGTQHDPVITTNNATFCHNITIQGGGTLVISPGKSMVVYGTVTLSGE